MWSNYMNIWLFEIILYMCVYVFVCFYYSVGVECSFRVLYVVDVYLRTILKQKSTETGKNLQTKNATKRNKIKT